MKRSLVSLLLAFGAVYMTAQQPCDVRKLTFQDYNACEAARLDAALHKHNQEMSVQNAQIAEQLSTPIVRNNFPACTSDACLAVRAKINDYEKIHPRKYIVGQPTEVSKAPDGSLLLLISWQAGPPPEFSPWVFISHPNREMVHRVPDPKEGGLLTPIGTMPDGRYYGFAWFMKRVPDAVTSGGRAMSAAVYETHPPDIDKSYAELSRLSAPSQEAKANPEPSMAEPDANHD